MKQNLTQLNIYNDKAYDACSLEAIRGVLAEIGQV